MRGKAFSTGIPSDIGRLRPQLPKKVFVIGRCKMNARFCLP